MAFKAKDLHYEKQEPAFLRRLRDANAAGDGRHNMQIARPKKDRLKTGDEGEDDPVIVDESGRVIGKVEFEGMQKGEPAKDDTGTAANEDQEDASMYENQKTRDLQPIAEVGASKKRKQVRVVGGDSDDEVTSSKATRDEVDDTAKPTSTLPSTNKQQSQETGKARAKKKAKKIKLSFDDPE